MGMELSAVRPALFWLEVELPVFQNKKLHGENALITAALFPTIRFDCDLFDPLDRNDGERLRNLRAFRQDFEVAFRICFLYVRRVVRRFTQRIWRVV